MSSSMIGRNLSHFKITAKLGEGGMGEVYRAEDSKLGREVAIKILPALFTEDPERLARFGREAKLLASLNHQNIAAIHQVEQVEGTHLLVMELVEGETLAERLNRGAIPVEESLPIALMIAEALEAAHDKGIIHRDLKPANIKLTPEGRVKVLDFGLAKAWAPPGREHADLSKSPTMSAQMSQTGLILGTAAYMSPEQAKGKPVDRRADIWAFGVVLWEMLMGERLFSGETVSEVLASVIMSRPDLKGLPPTTPPGIRRLLERCLRHDPTSRLRDIGDARIVLRESLDPHGWSSVEEAASKEKPRARSVAAALLITLGFALGAGLLSLWQWRQAPAPGTITHVGIPIAPTLRIRPKPLLTPDGRIAIFGAVDVDPDVPDHRPRLYTRRLDGNELVRVAGSEGVITHALSPDGRWLAFIAPVSDRSSLYRIVKVPLDRSAPPLKIADWPARRSASMVWPKAETILVIRDRRNLIFPFSADGGKPAPPVEIRSEQPVRSMTVTSVLPGGQHLLVYFATFESGVYRQDVGVLDSETGELRTLIEDASRPWYAPSGHLVISRRDTLLVAPFDLKRLEVTAGAQSVVDGLWAEGLYTGGTFSLSDSGDLLYGAGRVQGMSRFLATLTREGETTTWSDDRLYFNFVWGSPDGRRLAVQVDNIGEGDALLQIRVSDVERPRLVTVGSQPGKDCGQATWSTDSLRLAYLCWDHESTTLYLTTADGRSGSGVLLDEPAPIVLELAGFSAADSRVLLRRVDAKGSVELVMVPLEPPAGSGPTAHPIPMEEEDWSSANISADGHWLAYISNEAGRRQLFIREVLGDTSVGPRVLASSEVGYWAGWSKSIREGRYDLLFLREDQARLYSIEIVTEPSVRIAEPRKLDIDLFSLGVKAVDSLPDGRLLIVRAPDTEEGAPALHLVLNWTEELAGRIPASAR